MDNKKIKFKNDSYIKCLKSFDNQNTQISSIDFVEKIMNIKLLPYQKALLKICERPLKFARGQNYDKAFYFMLYKNLLIKYLIKNGNSSKPIEKEKTNG